MASTSTIPLYLPIMSTLTFPSFDNTTLLSQITPKSLDPAFYHTIRPSLLSFISDKHLSLLSPFLAYWGVSLIFHYIDTAKIPYFEKRRLHESPEVLSRNKVSVTSVVWMVILQQVIQTILGLLWFESDEEILRREIYRDHVASMATLAPRVGWLAMIALGRRTGEQVLRNHGQEIVRWVYWWGIPTLRLFAAFFVIDTWEYFIHRLFHTSTFLYRNFHSWHHRLYVPYAFGALYNHPLEGLLFDTLGAAVAHSLTGMTLREATLFFTLSTIKTVDDHSGYKLPWDPCQFLFRNNADYHDIHHQAYGIKANFSQPFFTNWDALLGTQMTREQANAKIRRPRMVQKEE